MSLTARLFVIFSLLFTLNLPFPALAQEPLTDLSLLAWLSDGTSVIGVTPGPVINYHQWQTLWRVPLTGGPPQRLAQSLSPQLSADGRQIIFTRPDAPDPAALWGLDLTTDQMQPLPIGMLELGAQAVSGDPVGQMIPAPDGRWRAILVNEFFEAALWLGQSGAPARRVLVGPGELFSDLAWRPDGQAVAFIRTPLGSQSDAAGEVWRFDLSENRVTRLSQNNVVDRSPLWRADGDSLVVVRNGRITVVPADRLVTETFAVAEPALPAPAEISAAAQLTPPVTIRVIHHASNTCRTVSVGHIDTIPFEEYVKRVVPYEVYPSWPAETLKAQAVAARTYGWSKYLANPDAAYHVTDWVNNQYMCDNAVTSTNQAVDATQGEYLAYNGQIITAMFSAENSSPTKTNLAVAYLQAVDDPVSFGKARNGHGYGMGQWGAQRWAAWHGWSYQAILRHYYSHVSLEEPTGVVNTPPNVALVRPWSNAYLTSNKVWLLVNSSDDSGGLAQTNLYLSTPVTTTPLFTTPGLASSQGYGLDVSAWADQPLDGTLVFTASATDGAGQRSVSRPVVVGLDRVNPTGLLTTTTTQSGTTLITEVDPVSLTLTVADDTSGAGRIALGRAEWLWEGESLTGPIGEVVSDSAALNGAALRATVAGDVAGLWWLGGLTLPAPQQYQAYFRLKVSDNSQPDEVAVLEIFDSTNALIGLRRLRGVDFRQADLYQEFGVDFNYQTIAAEGLGLPLTTTITFKDVADVWLDRFIVVEYPIAYTSQPTYPYTHFRLKVLDGAGNISEDLLVLPALNRQVYLPLLMQEAAVGAVH